MTFKEQVNSLARAAVIGGPLEEHDKHGNIITVSRGKKVGQPRMVYQLDDSKLGEFLNSVTPYFVMSALRSTYFQEEISDLVEDLQVATFDIIKHFGPEPLGKPFYESLRLIVNNVLTNEFRKRQSAKHKVNYSPRIPIEWATRDEDLDATEERVAMQELIEKIVQRVDLDCQRIISAFLWLGDVSDTAEALELSKDFVRTKLLSLQPIVKQLLGTA